MMTGLRPPSTWMIHRGLRLQFNDIYFALISELRRAVYGALHLDRHRLDGIEKKAPASCGSLFLLRPGKTACPPPPASKIAVNLNPHLTTIVNNASRHGGGLGFGPLAISRERWPRNPEIANSLLLAAAGLSYRSRREAADYDPPNLRGGSARARPGRGRLGLVPARRCRIRVIFNDMGRGWTTAPSTRSPATYGSASFEPIALDEDFHLGRRLRLPLQ